MAYIYARTKGSRKGFKMDIEDKHVYKNYTDYYIYVDKNPSDDALVSLSTLNPYCCNDHKVVAFDITNGFSVNQGTDEDERIGNKVFLKFMDLTYYITLRGGEYITSFSHGQSIDTYFRFRVMVVQFNETKTEAEIAEWFRNTYTYYRMKAIYQNTVPFQSVHTAKLRESTPFTGTFKELYDKKTCLKKNKTVKMSTIRIPIKMNVNFDNTTNKPTDESMKHIYLIVIGPCCNELDMDAVSNDQTKTMTGDSPLFNVACVAKYEYYDL